MTMILPPVLTTVHAPPLWSVNKTSILKSLFVFYSFTVDF